MTDATTMDQPQRVGLDSCTIELAMVRRDPDCVVMSRAELMRLAQEMQRSDKREATARRAVSDAMALAWSPSTFLAAALRHPTVDFDRVALQHAGQWLDVHVCAMFGRDGAMFQKVRVEEARS